MKGGPVGDRDIRSSRAYAFWLVRASMKGGPVGDRDLRFPGLDRDQVASMKGGPVGDRDLGLLPQ